MENEIDAEYLNNAPFDFNCHVKRTIRNEKENFSTQQQQEESIDQQLGSVPAPPASKSKRMRSQTMETQTSMSSSGNIQRNSSSGNVVGTYVPVSSLHRQCETQLSWNTASDASEGGNSTAHFKNCRREYAGHTNTVVNGGGPMRGQPRPSTTVHVSRERRIARNMLKATVISDGSDSSSEASVTKDSGRWSPKHDDPTNVAHHRSSAHIRVLRQPEEKHRARYLSEGSRGAVKDTTRTSFVTIQLIGYARPTTVEVYAGVNNETGQPHPLYRVIKVAGKGGSQIQHTPCQEVIRADGVHTLQVVCRPEYDMVAVLDCVGILKICSTQVSVNQLSQASNSKKRNKGCSKQAAAVRLIFRAQIPTADPQHDGGFRQICAMTYPILCVQQLGHPEVLKCSTTQSDPTGGGDLLIIGRNFDPHTVILFREYKEDGTLVWSAEATLDKKLLHQCHLVATLPTYRQLTLMNPVEVSMTIKCQNKSSHPMPFFYVPKGITDKIRTSTDMVPASTLIDTPVSDWEPSHTPAALTNAISTLPIAFIKSSPAPTPQPTAYTMTPSPPTSVSDIKQTMTKLGPPDVWQGTAVNTFSMQQDTLITGQRVEPSIIYQSQLSAPVTTVGNTQYPSILTTSAAQLLSADTVFYQSSNTLPVASSNFDQTSQSYGGEPTRKLVRYISQGECNQSNKSLGAADLSNDELLPSTSDYAVAINTSDLTDTYTNL